MHTVVAFGDINRFFQGMLNSSMKRKPRKKGKSHQYSFVVVVVVGWAIGLSDMFLCISPVLLNCSLNFVCENLFVEPNNI